MIYNTTVTNADLLSAIALFLVTFFGVMLLLGIKNFSSKQNKTTRTFVDSILSEYSAKLENYKNIITEIRAKVDLLESKIDNMGLDYAENTARNVKASDSLVMTKRDSTILDVTNSDDQRDINTRQSQSHTDSNNTIDIILKSLIETPRSARDIQHLINKSREHTSRVLKKLYLENLVSRDHRNTPFKYTITNEGRRRLH